MEQKNHAEFWDLYDKNRKPLGRKHRRGVPMEAETYHTVVGIWVVNTSGEILLTLRAPEKQYFPNLWENTGGSALVGESSVQAAVRELLEETGISVRPQELSLLGTTREKETFADTYIVCKDCPLERIRLQEGETVDAKWVTLSELDQIIQRGEIVPPAASQLLPIRQKFEAFLNKTHKYKQNDIHNLSHKKAGRKPLPGFIKDNTF